MMTTQEKFAEKLLQHIKEKHNSYFRIVNKEGTCAAFIKKYLRTQMWGKRSNDDHRDDAITYPVTYCDYNVWFAIGDDTWREPNKLIKHNCSSGPMHIYDKSVGDIWKKFYIDGITIEEIVKAIDCSSYRLNYSYSNKGDHVIDLYFTNDKWKISEFPIEKGDEMIKELESFVPYNWKENGPFKDNGYEYYINMDKALLKKKDNALTCFDLEYNYTGEVTYVPKISIEEFRSILISKYNVNEYFDVKSGFDVSKLPVGKSAIIDGHGFDWYELCYKAGVEDSKYDFSFENNEIEEIGITESGVPYLYGLACGDWEFPVGIVLYWDGSKLNYHIPLWGNTIRKDTLKAIGNDYDGEENGISDDEYVMNNLAPWINKVYNKDEIEKFMQFIQISPNKKAIIESFSKAIKPKD